eukprot:comp23852_c0_seq1/m.41695 comp23852_c0_seq1/g.41695  ORF comp23852_c0_seq1/g.41695 comp23852_c0_seq1/m.41695 type:complete len:264 (-) comp23852_c0_seq1:778-1569(-)
MVRLTAELIQRSPQFLNTLKDRELDLRGNKIPTIENLGATLDQFDTIDLSDNDITRLDGFPQLKRLKCIFLNNNRVARVGLNIHEYLPNLEELILTNNNVSEFTDIESLAGCKQLKRLTLLRNPVTTRKNYREYIVYLIPSVTLLDFRKVKQKEREEAARLFGPGGSMEAKKAKTFTPGEGLPAVRGETVSEEDRDQRTANGLTNEQIQRIKDAIARAKSLDEVRRLEAILQSGVIPDDSLVLSAPEPIPQQADGIMEIDEID